jgi:hypothetical protein
MITVNQCCGSGSPKEMQIRIRLVGKNGSQKRKKVKVFCFEGWVLSYPSPLKALKSDYKKLSKEPNFKPW